MPWAVSLFRVTTKFEPAAAKARLLQLVRERAYKDGIDIVLASGKRSTSTSTARRSRCTRRAVADRQAAAREAEGLSRDHRGRWPDDRRRSAGERGRGAVVRDRAEPEGVPGAQGSEGPRHRQRIEGDLVKGEKVAILEDTVTTGGSALKAIDAVLEVGAVPVVVMAIADREDPDADAFRKKYRSSAC
jgi:phosphoribosylpyrophosphate synthetase